MLLDVHVPDRVVVQGWVVVVPREAPFNEERGEETADQGWRLRGVLRGDAPVKADALRELHPELVKALWGGVVVELSI